MSNTITLYKNHNYIISPMIRNSLGNNLFQIAAICSHAHDVKISYIIEDSEYQGNHKSYNKTDMPLCKTFPHLICINSQKYFWELYNCELKDDKSEDIIPIKNYITSKLKTKLIGTFISYKYFHHNRKYILHLFDFSLKIKENVFNKYKELLDNNITISVHIRRGDFLKKLFLKKWCLLGSDYYQNAFNKIFNILLNKPLLFLFFYEDNESNKWIIKNLIPLIRNNKYELVSNAATEDMFLMSQCNYNIIANSTFSFWGAYLNKNNNVYAPNNWKNNDTLLDIKKRFPPEWEIIHSECNLTIV